MNYIDPNGPVGNLRHEGPAVAMGVFGVDHRSLGRLARSVEAMRQAGTCDETEASLLLNRAADDATRALPVGRRWRAFGGAGEIVSDRQTPGGEGP